MPDIHRIVIYARVSTKDRGQDPENQLQQLREFAQAQAWTVVHEYVDHVSGKTSDRVHFKKLFQDASLSQQEITDELGCSQISISRILRSHREPPPVAPIT